MSEMKTSKDEWEVATMSVVKDITRYLDEYKYNLAVERLREFFWHTYCDKWIEETKDIIQKDPEKKIELLARLIAILALQMKIMHPFAPFVTEKVWQSLIMLDLLPGESELLMVARWPAVKK